MHVCRRHRCSTSAMLLYRTLKKQTWRLHWYLLVLFGISGLLILAMEILRFEAPLVTHRLQNLLLKTNISEMRTVQKGKGVSPELFSSFLQRLEKNLLLKTNTSEMRTVQKGKGVSPELFSSFLQRLESLKTSPTLIRKHPCPPKEAPYCFRQPCNATFPPPKQRLQHIFKNQYPVAPQYRQWIEKLADQSGPKDVVFITAVSSNHFRELLGLFKQLGERVFPELRSRTTYTFKLLCYDLGMTARDIQRMTDFKLCASIIKVPLHELPESFMDLRTCAWKPLLFKANVGQSKVTVWMDSSVRFKGGNITTVLNHASSRGLFVITPGWPMPMHLAQEALRYFDVDPCLLSPFSEMAGGFIAVHNDEVMRSAVLDPWVACAFSPDCLCPGFDCYVRFKECRSNTSSPYSHCHRFDQATLGLITAYLFDWRVTAFYGGGYHWGQDVVDFFNLPNNYNMTPNRRPGQN